MITDQERAEIIAEGYALGYEQAWTDVQNGLSQIPTQVRVNNERADKVKENTK